MALMKIVTVGKQQIINVKKDECSLRKKEGN